MITGKVVAIDFDGTITKNSPYPVMGELRENCKEAIDFIRKNNTVVLWTCRCGKFLDEAINLLNENKIVIDFVNCIDSSNRDKPRKLNADIYIDDRNIFCQEINWLQIKQYFEN